MTNADQAVVLWPLLAFAARQQLVLTHTEVEGFTAIPTYGQADALHLIYLYCKDKEYPLLNAIVVTQDGFPGAGFPERDMKEPQFLIERARVWTFPWSARPKPSADNFVEVQSAAV